MPNDGPYQISRSANAEGGYDFKLIEVTTGKLVLGEYRCRSPVPPVNLRHVQAALNTRAMLH